MIRLIFIALICFITPSWAVEPDEVLEDPVLEARARSISAGLRCLQCRNESIDESNAGIARDLRLLVRDRLQRGDSDTEVMEYVVARYGEYVLLRPNGGGVNIVLWGAGPIAFLLALGGVIFLRRHPPQAADENPQLTKAEQQRLDALLRK